VSPHERLVRDEELKDEGHKRHAVVHDALRFLVKVVIGDFLLIVDHQPVDESDENLHGKGDLEEDGEPLPGSERAILVA